MTENTVQKNIEKDAYTLRDLLLLLLSYLKELWHKKWYTALLIFLCVGFMAYKANKAVIMYDANLTYVLNQPNTSLSAISGLLGSFGLNRSPNVNLDKVVELSKSRTLVHGVLFTKISIDTFDNRVDFIANHLFYLYPCKEEWENDRFSFEGFSFTHDSIEQFDARELYALKKLYEKVTGANETKDPVFTNDYNEDTGILTMTSSTPSESLSIQLCSLMFDALKRYYILTTTKGSQTALNFVQQKADSINAILKATEFQLTAFNDRNRNVIDPRIIAQRKIIEGELFKLKAMYGEVTKNQELADFSLTAGTPEIMIIDPPIAPLEAKVLTMMKAIIMGVLAGMITGIFFFTLRKLFLDALRASERATA